jgi:hypothetical protein
VWQSSQIGKASRRTMSMSTASLPATRLSIQVKRTVTISKSTDDFNQIIANMVAISQ